MFRKNQRPPGSRHPRTPSTRRATGVVILFNKPYGVLCQFSGDGTRPTLKDYLPQPDIYPAGRLDTDSEGLVVLTADGGLQHRIADPRHKMEKTYWVEVEGEPDEPRLAALRAGVTVRDYVTRPAQVERRAPPDWLWPRTPPVRFRAAIPTHWLELTIAEGRNRQVRHMTAAVGLPTLRLIRYRVGPWTLDGLASGAWRSATFPGAPSTGTGRAR